MSFRVLRKNLTTPVLAGALACGTLSKLSAQSGDPAREMSWKQVCAKAVAKPHTPPSFVRLDPDSKLRHCDSEALYYGFGRAPDPLAALQCAYYERAHPDPTRGDPFSGPGVLAMIYANGMGVRRDYDLAIRFACENPWAADAETEWRLGHLERLRDSGVVAKFDLCDDATSGLMEGACESVQQQFADAKRAQKLKIISRGWSPHVKEAFEALQEAENKFEGARTGNEVDLSGTGRAAFALAEQGLLRDQFLINLERFAKADIPVASVADRRAVESKLNAVYQQIQKSPGNLWEYGTINPSGIREAQRAWLKLRDAWIEFSRLAYPSLDITRIATQVTRLRLHQLQSLAPRH